jgi:hypothetical protein
VRDARSSQVRAHPDFTESASRYGAVKREMPGGGVPVDLL